MFLFGNTLLYSFLYTFDGNIFWELAKYQDFYLPL